MAEGPAKQVAGQDDEWETVFPDEWETVSPGLGSVRSGPPAVSLAPPPPFPRLTPGEVPVHGLKYRPAGAIKEMWTGAGKELASRAYQVSRSPLALWGKSVEATSPKNEAGEGDFVPPTVRIPTPEPLRPTNEQQVLGVAMERIAETLVAPNLWGARLRVIVPAIHNMATQAGVNWLQGGTPEEIALASALGALPSGVGVVTQKTGDWIRSWNPATVQKVVERIGKVLPSLAGAFGLTGGLGRGAASYAAGKAASTAANYLTSKMTSRLPGAERYAAPWLKPPRLPGVSAEDMARILPSLEQPEIQLPSELPKGKVVIRRPGQKPEIMDVEVDEQGRVRLKQK
jgi:hypothetical protein